MMAAHRAIERLKSKEERFVICPEGTLALQVNATQSLKE
jgi:hypothetical protein